MRSGIASALIFALAARVALTAPSVAADCSGPEAYGDAYAVEQTQQGHTPRVEHDELVVTVSAEGLAPGDGCPVAAADQFELNWFKHHDLAMIKLKRTAPKECVSGLRGTPKGAAEGVELRVPLPEELKHGTAHGDFSRMLLGLPPGGVFESYLLFDNSALTNTAAKWKATEAADEAAAAAEKLELFPEAATEGAEELAGNDGEGDDSAGERAAAGAAAGEASAGTAAA